MIRIHLKVTGGCQPGLSRSWSCALSRSLAISSAWLWHWGRIKTSTT